MWGAESEELNATLLEWPPGEGPGETASKLDVLYVVVSGSLTLNAGATRVRYGNELTLDARVSGLGGVKLQRRIGAGAWKTLKTVTGAQHVGVQPRAHTIYRLSAAGVNGPEVSVDVAPRLVVTPAGADLLAGDVEPATRGDITVLRRVASGWKVVAHPQLDARGTFHTPLKLEPGTYRVEVADDGRYASASANVHVTSRLLTSLGY